MAILLAIILATFSISLCVWAAAGGVFGYFLSFTAQSATPYLLPFAAGGFIYIAASDLMPEIRKERVLKKSVGAFLVFLLGIAIMFAAKFIGE
jgi:zinc and cadmium transporter